jgi:P27 family predicted phage terminase small subunit
MSRSPTRFLRHKPCGRRRDVMTTRVGGFGSLEPARLDLAAVAIFTRSQCENGKVTRTPIPPGLKILQGRGNGRDSGGRLVPVPPALERGLPETPSWLPPEVAAMWELIAPQVDELGAIKPQDGLILAALCEIAATYAAAVVDVYAHGQVLTNPKTGMPHKNPALAVAETARRDLLRYAREFALTPLAESLLGKLPRDDDEDDPFAAGGGYDQS